MLSTIVEASENFCIHQIREPHNVKDSIDKRRTLIAYIDIDSSDKRTYRVYIACEKDFVQKISKVFLEEDESDEETLIDMLLETTNLIVGSAKVIAEEANINPYTINTPHFIDIEDFDLDYDDAKLIQVGDTHMIIAIKELNA